MPVLTANIIMHCGYWLGGRRSKPTCVCLRRWNYGLSWSCNLLINWQTCLKSCLISRAEVCTLNWNIIRPVGNCGKWWIEACRSEMEYCQAGMTVSWLNILLAYRIQNLQQGLIDWQVYSAVIGDWQVCSAVIGDWQVYSAVIGDWLTGIQCCH